MQRPQQFGVAALLLAQALVLVSRFTTATLPESSEPWVRLFRHAGILPQIVLAIGTALLLFGPSWSARREREPARTPAARRSTSTWTSLLLAQLCAYAALYRATRFVLEEHLHGATNPWPWIAAWCACVVATCVLGLCLVWPWSLVRTHARRGAAWFVGAGLVGCAAWGAGAWVADELRLPLRAPTLWVAQRVLALVSDDAFVDAAEFVFGTSRFAVRVAPQCSGFEGIGLMLVFSLGYLATARAHLRFPRALLLPVIGVVLVWAVNALRLVALVLLGHFGEPELAAGGFHSIAGTLSFCVVALTLVAWTQRSHFFARPSHAATRDVEARGESAATAAYLTPFLVAIAVGMLVTAVRESGVELDFLRTLAATAALWFFRRELLPALGTARGAWLAVAAGVVTAGVWLATPAFGLGAVTREAAFEAPSFASDSLGATLASLVRIAGYVVVVPLIEELAFRGYLARRLSARDFTSIDPAHISIAGWIVSTVLFGLLHEHWVAATVAGAVFGWIYMRRGSLLHAWIAHAAANAALFLWASLRSV